jgi:ElaB/YqjD/DUF883 family membrane-anchored ribosome-binding protein
METKHFDGLISPDEGVSKVAEKVRGADEKLVAFVRERPLVALCAAVATGYLVGRLISRFG